MPIDPYLQEICAQVSWDEGIRFPITLFVSGMVVSGDLVCEREYLSGLLEMSVARSSDQAQRENWNNYFSTRMEAAGTQATTASPMNIHLKDAHTWTQAGRPLFMTPTWWRGNLEAVDGFVWGRKVSFTAHKDGDIV